MGEAGQFCNQSDLFPQILLGLFGHHAKVTYLNYNKFGSCKSEGRSIQTTQKDLNLCKKGVDQMSLFHSII